MLSKNSDAKLFSVTWIPSLETKDGQSRNALYNLVKMLC